MQVFQVVSEDYEDDGTIKEITQFVVAKDLGQVAIYFKDHCESLGQELKMIRYILTVVQDIREEK